MKWLPNALTILRCILSFVVGWAILEMTFGQIAFDLQYKGITSENERQIIEAMRADQYAALDCGRLCEFRLGRQFWISLMVGLPGDET